MTAHDPERLRLITDTVMSAGAFLAEVESGKRPASPRAIQLAEQICDNGLGSERARRMVEDYEEAAAAFGRGDLDADGYEEALVALALESEEMDAEVEEAAAELAELMAGERGKRR